MPVSSRVNAIWCHTPSESGLLYNTKKSPAEAASNAQVLVQLILGQEGQGHGRRMPLCPTRISRPPTSVVAIDNRVANFVTGASRRCTQSSSMYGAEPNAVAGTATCRDFSDAPSSDTLPEEHCKNADGDGGALGDTLVGGDDHADNIETLRDGDTLPVAVSLLM